MDDTNADIERLLAALDVDAKETRAEAVRALVLMGEERRIIAWLMSRLRATPFARGEAVETLGLLGASAPLDVLMAGLRDDDASVRAAAQRILPALAPHVPIELLRAQLHDPNRAVRDAAAAALPAYGPAYSEEIAAEYVSLVVADAHTRSFRVSGYSLAQAYARLPVETVTAALTEDNWVAMQEAAGEGLGINGQPPAVEALLALIEHRDEFVRVAAIKGLAELDAHAPIQVFVALLDRSSDLLAPIQAAYALGALSAYAPVEPLVAALNHQKSTVAAAAAESLGRFGERIPVDALLGALTQLRSNVGYAAAQSLGKCGERIPSDELVRAHAAVRDEHVRRGIREALYHAGSNASFNYLSAVYNESATDNETREAAIIALARAGYGETILDDLMAEASDPDINARARVMDVLGCIDSPTAREALVKRAGDIPENYGVRMCAAYGLVAQGDRITDDELLLAMEFCNDSDMQGYDLLTEVALVRRPIPRAAAMWVLDYVSDLHMTPEWYNGAVRDEMSREINAIIYGSQLVGLPKWICQVALVDEIANLGYASPEMADTVIELARSPRWQAQIVAAQALIEIDMDSGARDRARERMRQLLSSLDESVRGAAAAALAAFDR